MGVTATPSQQLSLRDRIIITILIGVITCIVSISITNLSKIVLGDFRYGLSLARDWLAGNDPYLPFKLNIDPHAVPYPFTANLFTIPLVWLPNKLAD